MTEKQKYELRTELCDLTRKDDYETLNHPDSLQVGDRVTVTGFADDAFGDRQRSGEVIEICKHFIRIRFDAGYTEAWSRRNLMRALNGKCAGGTYTAIQRNKQDPLYGLTKRMIIRRGFDALRHGY